MLSYQCISSDGIELYEKMQSFLIEMSQFHSFFMRNDANTVKALQGQFLGKL
jgi:hypothetical protein